MVAINLFNSGASPLGSKSSSRFTQRFISRVLLITLSLSIWGFPSAWSSEIHLVDLVSINWQGSNPSSTSLAKLQEVFKSDVAPRWKRYSNVEGEENSKGINFQLGLALPSSIQIPNSNICSSEQSLEVMFFVRQKVYKALGIENNRDRYLVILAPEAGCIWSGRASIGELGKKGGTVIMHNTASALVLAHELGHTLGLGHSNFLRCDSGKSDGPWGSDCKAVEYGGTVDLMGNVDVDSPLSTYHQWRLGLIKSDQVHESWLNEEIELSATDVTGSTRAIFIRDKNSGYWIEYRRKSLGNSYSPGLVVFRTDPPPISSVVSPNPEDSIGGEFGSGVLADIWMLNWGNYTYSRSQAAGSMTLALGEIARAYSGNISISAIPLGSTDKGVKVVIKRSADVNPPPTPELTNISTWRSPDSQVISRNYRDIESTVNKFELKIDEKLIEVEGSPSPTEPVTFLTPLKSAKTLLVSDLPEGNYELSVRGIDAWGNKSAWSSKQRVLVDRSFPKLGQEIEVLSISQDSIRLAMSGVKDDGIGLCMSRLVNEDGFVSQFNENRLNPELVFKANGRTVKTLEAFDCLGNGVSGEFSMQNSFYPASKSSRTGKWSNSKEVEGALTCKTRCSASFAMAGNVHVMLGEGSASLSVSGKRVEPTREYKGTVLKNIKVLSLGKSKRVLRITGSNFTLFGIASINLSIMNIEKIKFTEPATDVSLNEPAQFELSKFGLRATDFAGDWRVFPMARGTTLQDPTLDLCGFEYFSERDRQSRRQVTVFKSNMPYIFLSSEVVKYKTKDAARFALNELKKNYLTCLGNGELNNSDGTLVKYEFKPLPSSDAKLVPENSRILIQAKIIQGDQVQQLLGFYQFYNEMFSGLYIVKGGESGFGENEIQRWFEAASLLATRLETKY